MDYIVNVKNRSGESGTFIPDFSFSYSRNLNQLSQANLKFSGSGVVSRGLFETGSEVSIYRSGSLDFLGVVDMIDRLDGGTLSVNITGFEFWLTRENGNYDNSPYVDVASSSIFEDIISESNYWSFGSASLGFDLDFRLNESQSLWNAIINLLDKTQQDLYLDYNAVEASVVNHLGSVSSVGVFNDGIEISNVRYTEGYPAGNRIIVLGKGDGSSQVRATASDASSISLYGVISRTIIDRSILSVSEAQLLANAELELSKNPTKIFDFELNNPYQDIGLGDVITLNSPDKDVVSEDVRVVSVVRGIMNGREYCTLQVTNPEYKKKVANRNSILAGLKKESLDSNSYMQGSGNTLHYSHAINAQSGSPHRNIFYVSPSFIENQIGDVNVSKMLLSFDVEPFRGDVGTASEEDRAPNINDAVSSAATHNHNVSDSGHQHLKPTEVSALAGGASVAGVTISTASASSVGTASWTALTATLSVTGTTQGMFIFISWMFSSTPATSAIRAIDFRVNRDGGDAFFPASVGIRCLYAKTDGVIPFGTACIWVPEDGDGRDYEVEARGVGDTESFDFDITQQVIQAHSHNIGSTNVNSNNAVITQSNVTPSVTGATVNHNHNVSIDTGIEESSSVVATDVSVKLDYWNGTSWVEKEDFGFVGTLKGEDFDLTDGGVYPDTAGFWRVRLEPNGASPDYVYSLVEIQHFLDND